ncbi:MAG: AarF/UbiB family protein [Sporolactobacillus sp.]
MFVKHIRHLNRYREIVSILVKYGFGYIVRDVGLFHLLSLPKQMASDLSKQTENTTSAAEKIRKMLEELGPTFIKLGQMLSLRSDIVPLPIANELCKLQDAVAPIDHAVILNIVQEELGGPIETLFAEFNVECLAAASIAEVHRARLKSGEEVVIKIRRPDIENIISDDIDILWDLAALIDKRYTWARELQLTAIVQRFSEAIRSEIDYFNEARHTEKIYTFFKGNSAVIIPKVYRDFSTNRLLTLEYIHGMKFSELVHSTTDSAGKRIIAERIIRSFLDQALEAGMFHGDPHPGNFFFLANHVIAWIDFGQVGTLNEDMKTNFASLIIGLMHGNIDMLQQAVLAIAQGADLIDEREFRADLFVLRSRYYNLPFRDVHIGKVVQDIFVLTKKHHITIPASYTLLAKAIITLEGMINRLDSTISILEIAEPYGRKLLLKRLNPQRIAESWLHRLHAAAADSMLLPPLLKKTLQRLYTGKTHVEMELPQLDRLLNKLDRAANRIAFSMILLAFSILLGALIVGGKAGHLSFLNQVPILDITVMVTAVMFLIVLLTIFRSGKF